MKPKDGPIPKEWLRKTTLQVCTGLQRESLRVWAGLGSSGFSQFEHRSVRCIFDADGSFVVVGTGNEFKSFFVQAPFGDFGQILRIDVSECAAKGEVAGNLHPAK